MPNYDFRCRKCGKEWEGFALIKDRNRQECECGGNGEIVFGSVAVDVFKPVWFEDIAEHPIWIESKKQLKRETESRGLKAVRLM